MADKTAIEWTDATWNPITGCSIVSPGCRDCYAMRLAGTRLRNQPSRAGLTQESKAGPVWTGDVRFNERALTDPLRWKKPRRIFVCAHGDLFHENVPDAWIDRVFAIMALAPHHTFQVLTKRARRMREYFDFDDGFGRWGFIEHHARKLAKIPEGKTLAYYGGKNLPNVWLGVSVEDQRRAEERIPDLLETPAAIRWISAEPLLGPLDLRAIDVSNDEEILPLGAGWLDRLEPGEKESARLDWVVAGGESGPTARPMHPAWVRALRDQCAAADVPFLFKQWGEHRPLTRVESGQACGATRVEDPDAGHALVLKVGKKRAGRLLDGRLHDAFPGPRPAANEGSPT